MKTLFAAVTPVLLFAASTFAHIPETVVGKVEFTPDVMGPPRFMVTGDAAAALYNYLNVPEVHDPDTLGNTTFDKNGKGVVCIKHGTLGYECDFSLTATGVETGYPAP